MKIRLFLLLIAVVVFQVLEAAEAPADVQSEDTQVKTKDENVMDATKNVVDTPRNLADMKILKLSGRLHKRSPKKGHSRGHSRERYGDRYGGRYDDRYGDAYVDLYRRLSGTDRYGYGTQGSYYQGGRSRGPGGRSRGRGGHSRGRGGRSRGRGGRSRGRGGRSRERYDWSSDDGYYRRQGYGYGSNGGHIIAVGVRPGQSGHYGNYGTSYGTGSSNCDCPFNVDDLSQEQYGHDGDENSDDEYQRQWQRAFSSHPCCRQRWQVYWSTHHSK